MSERAEKARSLGGRHGRVRSLPWVAAAVVLALAGASALVAGSLAEPRFAEKSSPRVLPEVPVTAMDLAVGRAHNSPSLAADPTEARFVVLANRLDGPDFSCALQVSGDGGRSWVSIDPVPELPPGAEKCYGPEVAFDRGGILHYLFIGLHGQGNEPMGAFLTTSGDRGQTFSTPHQVLGPLNFGVRMAIDTDVGRLGRIHLVWLHAMSDPPLGGFGPPPNPILAAHSDDGGKTFSEPVQVSDPDRLRVVAPALTLGPDGSVHAAYYDLGDDVVDYQGLEGGVWEGAWSLLVATSTDGGGQFSPSVPVDTEITPPGRVMLIFTMPPASLAAGPGDRLCAAWTDGRHGDPDVLLRCSADRGRTWNSARRLNDDAEGSGASQYLPRLSVAPGGRLDAVFLDRRRDPRNRNYDVMYTSSRDGVVFRPNVRLTTEASSSLVGARFPLVPSAGDQVEVGARLGLLSRAGTALVAWPDTRNAVVTNEPQDLFATTVTLPRAARPSPWVAPLGIALIAAAAVAAALATVVWRRGRRGAAVEPVTPS